MFRDANRDGNFGKETDCFLSLKVAVWFILVISCSTMFRLFVSTEQIISVAKGIGLPALTRASRRPTSLQLRSQVTECHARQIPVTLQPAILATATVQVSLPMAPYRRELDLLYLFLGVGLDFIPDGLCTKHMN